MGQQNPTLTELTRAKRAIVGEMPFTCPVVDDDARRIVINVPECKRGKFDELSDELGLAVVDESCGGKSQQGWRDRLELTPAEA